MGRILVALLIGGSLAAPPEPGPRAEGAGESLAIAWRLGGPESDAPTPGQRQALRERVAESAGQPLARVRDGALDEARRVTAYDLPVSVRDGARAIRRGLDRADEAYRAGDFERARSEALAVLDQLHASPIQPGAVARAREAHLLLAKLSWAEGQEPSTLLDALRLDPSAQLSARAAPPGLVEAYERAQAELLATRDSWREPSIELPAGLDPSRVTLEIDGIPGLRPVVEGAHFIVARIPGYEGAAAWHERDEVWVVPELAERIPAELPAALEQTCATLGLDVLILAERRGPEVGVQAHACGRGNAPLSIAELDHIDGLDLGLSDVALDPGEPALFGVWPERIAIDLGLIEPPLAPVRPWYRKGWIWGTGVGAVVLISGAIAAGVLLGGARSTSIRVDATPFIGGS